MARDEALTQAADADAAPVTVARSQRFDLPSKRLGRALRILVATPFGTAPAAGWPVIYVLDGFENFATAAQIVRHHAFADGRGGAVVVGIAYADPKTGAAQRLLDLTTPTSQAVLDRQGRKDVTEASVGGLDTFLDVIETEVKPAVAARATIDAADQTLFGHSLGGLAVLRSLFLNPQRYRTFLAASPSIWWNERAVLADEAAFSARVEAGEIAPRVFICVGKDEVRAGRIDPAAGIPQAQADKMFRRARMVSNARALAARLAVLRGAAGYAVESAVFPDEGHMSVVPAALSRGLRFALRGAGGNA